MKKSIAKLAALGMAVTMVSGSLTGCGNVQNTKAAEGKKENAASTTASTTTVEKTTAKKEEKSKVATTTAAKEAKEEKIEQSEVKKPKYVFLFIGDGMSYPQVESTNYYLSALENGTSMGKKDEGTVLADVADSLSFLSFPVAGSAQTYDRTSFCPDSASTATSISTGYKTYSGTINMDETGTVSYETISEKLKKQLGYKIGVISTVNLNHATPAAFYSHQAKRSSYYEIGLELIDSGFDYFAGGGLLKQTGSEGDKEDLYELAKKAGYTVVNTQEEAEKINSKSGKTIIIDEFLADGLAMDYEIDREDTQWALSDYVAKGIDCLYEDNENGFFMMVEGGKIDWACHANDAASTMLDTKALSDAVDEAVEFYNKHPEDTLILVTGDHETGGMTIGYAGTNYDTFLQNLSNQKISFKAFDDEYVSKYKENNTSFDDVMKDVKELFGLEIESAATGAAEDGVAKDSADQHPTGVTSGSLVLTEYELGLLRDAYDRTMDTSEDKEFTQADAVHYGSYEPLSVTITHILNNKSGIAYTSYSHTGLPVAVFAMGNGENQFEGYYDNTDIYDKMAELLEVK